MRGGILALIALLLLLGAACDSGPPDVTTIRVGGTPVRVEIADSQSERRRGLSGRDSLGAGRGMLFVFDQPQILRFWMKDTHFDLDIGFFDAEGRLVSIESMRAEDTQTITASPLPALYALEVPAGWFDAHDIPPDAMLNFGSAR
ncbi:MAG: DUF192 domain-containing protein [Chromatiales bacterium]|nr:DUF192 domain-containing protein [Chromatiales bacterium]